MNRRAFLIGNGSALFFLAGCFGSSPSGSEGSPTSSPTSSTPTKQPTEPTPPQQEHRDACSGAKSLSFYALESETADKMWGPSTVRVAFSLGAGGHVRLVVLENSSVLGMTHVETQNHVSIDGAKIPLDTKLSGKHTIRAVMYPDTAERGQFTAKETTPCHHGGTVIQTDPTTINFSSFSENT